MLKVSIVFTVHGIQRSFDHFLLAQEDVETLRGQYVSRVMDI